MEKIIALLSAAILGIVGFLLGRGSRRDVNNPDTGRAISDIREAAGKVAESGDEIASIGREAGRIAEGAGQAGRKLKDIRAETACIGAESKGGREDSERESKLLAELNRRLGEAGEESKGMEHRADGDQLDSNRDSSHPALGKIAPRKPDRKE